MKLKLTSKKDKRMNLIISIGPDLLSTKRYKTKDACQAVFTRLLKKKVLSYCNLELSFLGRKYNQFEVRNAILYTPQEFFERGTIRC
jgi:hypothetical protein